MAYESGGRADKYGNDYENAYFARLLLRLVEEKLRSVEVEPLGPNSDAVEFIATDFDGRRSYYQCKGSNSIYDKWRIGDLARHDVFSRLKSILESEPGSRYFFISPLPYGGLDELCRRARTNHSAQDFAAYQLTNQPYRMLFDATAQQLRLDKNDDAQLRKIVSLLARCHFEIVPWGEEARLDLEERIGWLFRGVPASSIRVQLEQMAHDSSAYGVPITANDVIAYLGRNGVKRRDYSCDDRILTRVQKINQSFRDGFRPIRQTIFPRAATEQVFSAVMEGRSILLHGKAGAGKSGCLQELAGRLEKQGILYLAVRLDQNVPSGSSDQYGEMLGLPESPVRCLLSLSVGKPCVLILDQLDALRWAGMHAERALRVCRELIREAARANREYAGRLSLLFVCRSFDLETGSELAELFSHMSEQHGLIWEKICVNPLSKEETTECVGDPYGLLSPRLRELLRTPAVLFVWSQLKEQDRYGEIHTGTQLMQVWWRQLQSSCARQGLPEGETAACVEDIVSRMMRNSRFSLPVQLFSGREAIVEALASGGLLTVDAHTVSFTHQSFLDFFAAVHILREIYDGKTLQEIFTPSERQLPSLRYRFQIVLQSLLESDSQTYVQQGTTVLNAADIHSYFQCAVFEALRECSAPDETILRFVKEWLWKPAWHDFVFRTVFWGRTCFAKRFPELSGKGWLEEEGIRLLASISEEEPSFVLEQITPFAFQSDEIDKLLWGALCFDASSDSEEMYCFRLKLLRRHPALWENLIAFLPLLQHRSAHVIPLFRLLLETREMWNREGLHVGDEKERKALAVSCSEEIVSALLPVLRSVTEKLTFDQRRDYFTDEYRLWAENGYHESVVRKIVELIKWALEAHAADEPEKALSILQNTDGRSSAVVHEVLMAGAAQLPKSFADQVLEWLLSDFENKIFVYTANAHDFLVDTKKILRKFSPFCNKSIFQELERRICVWKEPTAWMVEQFQRRRQRSRQAGGTPVYYAYWGYLQKELLPELSSERISPYVKELLKVVRRNPWIHAWKYSTGLFSSEAQFVSSPLDGKVDRIRDRTWLQIIATPKEKLGDRWHNRAHGDQWVEVSHEVFARSFLTQAKLEPTRFAKLSLLFPKECNAQYHCSVLAGMAECAREKIPDLELMSEVIRRSASVGGRNVLWEIERLIETRAEQDWPEDILELLKTLALSYVESMEEDGFEGLFSPLREKTEPLTLDTLRNGSINSIRGYALYTIAELLKMHGELRPFFRETVRRASEDDCAAVWFMTPICVVRYAEEEPAFAASVFRLLVQRDVRALGAIGGEALLWEFYPQDPAFCRRQLLCACGFRSSDLAPQAAGLLCAAALFWKDETALSELLTGDFTKAQQDAICRQAVKAFSGEDTRERSKIILLHFMDRFSGELYVLKNLFEEKSVDLTRDKEFLIALMRSRQGVFLWPVFLTLLCEWDGDPTPYAAALAAACGTMAEEAGRPQRFWLHSRDLAQCVLRTLDRFPENSQVRELCLSLWDELYRADIVWARQLSGMLDRME
ncbi:MAG TPA: ATP-binding protein [Candidatus Caccousia avistercoris]|nr:ATP-binding protein [Candidatus Caccousia avistercoris]